MDVKEQPPGFHLLAHSAHLIEDRQRRMLRPLGLHAGQARVLHVLSDKGEASQRMLADQFDVSAASMSEMTKRLIANGFIQSRPSPEDGRSSLLSLTPKGRKLAQQVFEVWRALDELIADAIGAERAGRLFADSMALRDALGGRAPGRDKAN